MKPTIKKFHSNKQIKSFFVLTLFAILLVLVMYSTSWADTHYVSSNGNDANPGTINSPFKTIQKGIDTVQAGDTCFVRTGTYYEALVLKRSGTSSARITLKNYNGETVTINSGNSRVLRSGGRRHYYTIDGLRFISNYVAYESNSDYTIDFENGIWDGVDNPDGGNNGFILKNCYIEGAIHFYGHYNLVENCELNGRNQWKNGIWDYFAASHDNVYRNNVIRGYKIRGIWTMQKTRNIQIENNTIHDIGGMGIDLDGATPPVYDSKVTGNHIYQITGEGIGITMENAFDAQVEKNLVHDVTSIGIEIINYGKDYAGIEYRHIDTNSIIRNNIIYDAEIGGIVGFSSPGASIFNNTIYNTRASGGYYAAIALSSDGSEFWCNNWKIKNNIIIQNNAYGIWIDAPEWGLTGLELSNNLFYHSYSQHTHYEARTDKEYYLEQYQSATGQESGSIFADPQFVDLANYDFHLQMTSPAIDAGAFISVVNDDFDGNSRPLGLSHDIGAYEYVSDNQSPAAFIRLTPALGDAPLLVNFDASDSFDPDGSIISYHWDFGDGNTGNGISPTHIYNNSGIYSVLLTVSDNHNATDSDAAAITVNTPDPDNPQPLGLWHLDEPNWSGIPGEVYDASGKDNHGTAENGANTVANGKIGRAGIFDGTDDYIDIGNAPILNITGDQLTLAAWVNILELPSSYMGILSKGGYSSGYRCLVDSSGAILFQLTGSSFSLTTDTTLSPGVWHHIVATYDGFNMRVYIDGEKDNNEKPRTGNLALVS